LKQSRQHILPLFCNNHFTDLTLLKHAYHSVHIYPGGISYKVRQLVAPSAVHLGADLRLAAMSINLKKASGEEESTKVFFYFISTSIEL